ncbi:MAG: DUF3299 domain-containing protein [Planctomycetota bacterium]
MRLWLILAVCAALVVTSWLILSRSPDSSADDEFAEPIVGELLRTPVAAARTTASAASREPRPETDTPAPAEPVPAPLPTPKPTAEIPPQPPTAAADGIVTVAFADLAGYKYQRRDAKAAKNAPAEPDQIPASIRVLDKRRIEVNGYMIPLDGFGVEVQNFFLVRNTLACCYGQAPEMNEIIEVTFEKPVRFQPDILHKTVGRFEVGEVYDSYGYLSSIYRLRGESMKSLWGQSQD